VTEKKVIIQDYWIGKRRITHVRIVDSELVGYSVKGDDENSREEECLESSHSNGI